MISKVFHYSLLVIIFSVTLIAHAATKDFIVQTQIGEDTTPPTVPAPISATPVATSQIDLTWGTSTDDFLLSGYQVFRDDIQIATTTATSYSDVGLTASTTYSYYVTAFDSSDNISASSSVVATTTLAPPPIPPATPPRNNTGTLIKPFRLLSLEVIPQKDSVLIRYETAGYVRSVIRWGRSISYELGSLSERSFTKIHETNIVGLIPDTLYKFVIEGENSIGEFGRITESTFTTLPTEDIFPPGNVRNLRAIKDGNDIVLSWINPQDPDLEKVRIIRNEQFFPGDIADGWLVYEGKEETMRDVGMAVEGTRQYYTVFSYDVLGNISSGAIVSIRVDAEGASVVDVFQEELNPIDLNVSDINFIQDGTILSVQGNKIIIDGTRNLTISLPYDRVPEHLKSILVSLVDRRDPDKEFLFLLRVNADKTAYVSTLAPLGVSGNFPFRISVFDFKTSQIGYVSGTIVSEIVYIQSHKQDREGLLAFLIRNIFNSTTGYIVWFIILLILLTFGARRLMRTEW